MIQKVVLITVIVILVGTLTLLAVFYFGGNDTKQTIKDLAGDQVSLISRFTDTIKEPGKTLTRISSDGVSTYGIVPNGRKVAFFDSNGIFKIADLIGNLDYEGESTLANNIRDGVWSLTEMKAIITTVSSDGVRRVFYDYRNGEVDSINDGIQDIVFSRDGKRIAYNFFDEATYEGNISISKADGSAYVMLLKTRLLDAQVDWPKDDLITFYKRSSNPKERVELFKMNNKGEELEKILTDKLLLRVLWAPDGKSLIYSENTDDQNHLYYKFIESGEERDLDINVMADQCAWSKTNIDIICFDNNRFYKINVLDNSKKEVYKLHGEADVKNLTITPTEDYLLFINNGQLYSLPLR